jgi:hypothetical protein
MRSLALLITRLSSVSVLAFAATSIAYANPNVLTVFPSYNASGQAISLTVNGTGFSGGTVLVLVSGVQQNSVSVNAAGTQLTVGLANYPPGDYKLRVAILPYTDDGHAAVLAARWSVV